MKKFKIWSMIMLVILSILMMVACGSDDDREAIKNNPKDVGESIDTYYVKYEVKNGQQVSWAKKTERKLRCKDVGKEITNTIYEEWEGTYGPFKKGDQVYFYVTTNGRYNSNARLSVSKNKEAFTTKAEQREASNIDLIYTINY